jgi:hypothetical protein
MGKAGVLMLCVLLGCSGGKTLDKVTAAREIKVNLSVSGNVSSATIGRVGTSCVELDPAGREKKLNLDPGADIGTLVAQRAGYLTVTPDGKGFWKIALTEQGSAALAAAKGKPYAHRAHGGCDYQLIDFLLATPELVDVVSVTADENNPEVDYLWKWKTTDLGRMLRQDGKIFPSLTLLQQAELQNHIFSLAPRLNLPAPQENFIGHDSVKFQRLVDGWRIK